MTSGVFFEWFRAKKTPDVISASKTCPRFLRFCGKQTRPLLLLLLATSVSAQVPQVRPSQADGVVRLLTDIENTVSSNNTDEFIRLTAVSLPSGEMGTLMSSLFRGGQTSAVVRERDRRPQGTGYSILVEILIARGDSGRIITWDLKVRPNAGEAGRYEIFGATPVASVDGLAKLRLDTSQQFSAHDLVVSSPGLTLQLSSGTVFLAHVEEGHTALVFRGKGTMRFAPEDPAEQVQVRTFSGKPALETPIEAIYLRLSPDEFPKYIASSHLTAVDTNPGEAARARALFAELSVKSYTLSLGDLTTEQWSLLPLSGSLLAEIRTNRFGTLTYARSRDDAEDVSLFDRARNRNISVYASTQRLAARGRSYSEDDMAAYDVLHYAVDVRIEPEREWLTGRGSVKIKTRRDLSSLSLKLAEPLAVTSISSPMYGRLLGLRISGQSGILISLPSPLPGNSELTIDISYSGRLAPQNIDREGLVVEADVQQAQDLMPSLDRPLLPEPRYLYSNRTYWYPQASITDFATADLRVTVPAQFQVVGSGTLVSSVVTTERTVQFAADRPVRYLSCIISRFLPVGGARARVPAVADARGPGTEVGRAPANGAVTVDVVATPRLLRPNRALPERTARILEFYGGLIGEAPYPDFSLATLDAELPSGHSPAYFAIWNQPSLPSPLSFRDDPVALNGHPFFFLAHEVAHQWWGQAIGWKNYHEQWLSEGLAQYFATLYAGFDRGPEVERQLLLQMRESAMNLSRHGPVHMGYRLGHIQADGRIFRGLVYNKSAIVVEMLRRFIGPEAFGRGIQRFYRTHRFTKAGTDDFQQAFEQETTLPLSRFFDRWIRGFTLPEVQLNWRMADPTHLAVRIEQLGETFDFPLTLTLQHADGRLEQVPVTVTTPVHDAVIPVTAPVRRVDARDDTGLVIVKR